MKEIDFIDGKTKIQIKNDLLVAYLEGLESAGFVVKANKCKTKEGFRDVLMIGRAEDLKEFFSATTKIKEIYKQEPRIYRLLFNNRELVLYLLAQDDEIA